MMFVKKQQTKIKKDDMIAPSTLKGNKHGLTR